MNESNHSVEDLVSDAFSEVLEPRAEDVGQLDAMIDQVVGTPTVAPPASSLRMPLVLVGVGVLVGAMLWVRGDPRPTSAAVASAVPEASSPPEPAAPTPAIVAREPAPVEPPEAPRRQPEPPAAPAPVPPATVTRPEPSTTQDRPRATVASPTRRAPAPAAPDAQSLLRLANQARRDHDYLRADTLFSRLHEGYPQSRAATLALVTQARMRLDHLSRPRAALEGFDAYLARRPDGTLAHEAMVGRARALERLGQTAQAEAAWRAVAERFPESIHADRGPR